MRVLISDTSLLGPTLLNDSSLHRFLSADLERLLHSSYWYPPISIAPLCL